jgi:hypothetical protein
MKFELALASLITLLVPLESSATAQISYGSGGCSASNRTAKRQFELRDSGGGAVACNSSTCTYGPFTYDLDNMDAICSNSINFVGAAPYLAGWRVDVPNQTTFGGITVGFSGFSFNTTSQVLTFYVDVGLRNSPGGAADPNNWIVYGEIIGVYAASPGSAGITYSKSCSASSDTCTLSVTETNALLPRPGYNYVGDSITKITLDAHNSSSGFTLTDLKVKSLWSQPAGTRDLALAQTCKAGGANNISCTVNSVVLAATSTELATLQTTRTHTGNSTYTNPSFAVASTNPRHHLCGQRGFELYFSGSTDNFVTLAAGATIDCDTNPAGDWSGVNHGALDTGASDLFDFINYLNGTKLK